MLSFQDYEFLATILINPDSVKFEDRKSKCGSLVAAYFKDMSKPKAVLLKKLKASNAECGEIGVSEASVTVNDLACESGKVPDASKKYCCKYILITNLFFFIYMWIQNVCRSDVRWLLFTLSL